MKKSHVIPRPALPDGYAHLGQQPELAAAWEREVTARQAAAEKIEHLMAYRDRVLGESPSRHVLNERTVLKSVYRDAAVMLGMTEAAVRRLLDTATFVQRHMPQTWEQHRSGVIDLPRVHTAAQAAGDLVETTSGNPGLRTELVGTLDAEFADRAPGRNPAVLGDWLKRRVAELDTAGHQERYTRARSRRYVNFQHRPDGMSRLEALLPTTTLAPLEQDLHTAVKTMPRRTVAADTAASGRSPDRGQGAEAERTYPQRMADVFLAWLTEGATGNNGRTLRRTGAKINILVPLETLTGDSDAAATSTDGSFTLPADEVRGIAADPEASHEWFVAGTESESAEDGGARITRLVKFGAKNPLLRAEAEQETGPGVTSEELAAAAAMMPNLLDITSEARFVTGNLREGVLTRDGHCQAFGCTEAGYRSEVDHRKPYDDGGETRADNAIVLCRDHHGMKALGLLPLPGPAPPDPPWHRAASAVSPSDRRLSRPPRACSAADPSRSSESTGRLRAH